MSRLFCGKRWPSGAITPDDSEKWVRFVGMPRQEIAARWKGREEVLFVVRERGQG